MTDQTRHADDLQGSCVCADHQWHLLTMPQEYGQLLAHLAEMDDRWFLIGYLRNELPLDVVGRALAAVHDYREVVAAAAAAAGELAADNEPDYLSNDDAYGEDQAEPAS